MNFYYLVLIAIIAMKGIFAFMLFAFLLRIGIPVRGPLGQAFVGSGFVNWYPVLSLHVEIEDSAHAQNLMLVHFLIKERKASKINSARAVFLCIVLVLRLSNDIALNPGPRAPKYPCQVCIRACR